MLEFLKISFPIAGIETYWFLPPLVAFCISFFASMGGVSGAFLILPFQMSVLGFTSPSVSSTNFLYNLVGIPGGVYRYIREGRMCWPLAIVMVTGTLPGVLIGYIIRVKYLPDPKNFKFFVGIVLLYIGYRLFLSIRKNPSKNSTGEKSFRIENSRFSIKRVSFDFLSSEVSFSTPLVFILSLLVGVVGGIYGIGGGSILAPFLVSVLGLPVYVVAGAVLLGTFMTSISGLLFYSLLPLRDGVTAPPDWLLGILFGLGGLAGMYLGARAQKRMPERVIKLILAIVILLVSGKYIVQFFR